MARKLVLSIALLALAVTASAADQKILVPIWFNAPGAGATWQTFLIVNNRTSKPYSSSNVQFLIQCPIPEGCFSDSIPAGQFASVVSPTSRGGILFTAPAEDADKLIFRLAIGARPRDVNVRGTEIPIARERDLRTDFISLPQVVLGGPVRTRLRIYDPDQHADARVRVSLRNWFQPAEAPVASIEVALERGPAFFPILPAPVTAPAYAEVDLQAAFADAIPRSTYFNVDVEPLTPGLRFWAFVTITDNATNDVQTVTPH